MNDEYEHRHFWHKEPKFDKSSDIVALAAWLVFVGLMLFVFLVGEWYICKTLN